MLLSYVNVDNNKSINFVCIKENGEYCISLMTRHLTFILCLTINNIDWLIDWLFHVQLKKFSLIWRRHRYRWRAAKFRPMLGAQGLWAGRHLYRATPSVTRGLGFFRSHPKDLLILSPLTTHKGMWRIYSYLDPRRSPFSHLLRHTRRCGGPILTRILTGPLTIQ
jgi:hypothetical protein